MEVKDDLMIVLSTTALGCCRFMLSSIFLEYVSSAQSSTNLLLSSAKQW
jgi:hypothetical protein